jgi:hypothetical protein
VTVLEEEIVARPPERWIHIDDRGQPTRDWRPGYPIRYNPGTDVHSLIENILDPNAPELIEPADPFQTKRIVAEAMREIEDRKDIDFTVKQAIIIGWHLWGEGYPEAGLIWANYRKRRSFDSLSDLRHLLAEAHRWPVKRIAAQLGTRNHGYVGQELRRAARKLNCPPGMDHRNYLREVANKGLQKLQIRLVYGSP